MNGTSFRFASGNNDLTCWFYWDFSGGKETKMTVKNMNGVNAIESTSCY